MTTLKRIPPAQNQGNTPLPQPTKPRRQRTMTMEDGFVFAFGFWLATLIILIPIGFCLGILGLYN